MKREDGKCEEPWGHPALNPNQYPPAKVCYRRTDSYSIHIHTCRMHPRRHGVTVPVAECTGGER